MLSRDKAEHMLDTASFEEAARQLTESGYEDMSGFSIKGIEDALAVRRADVFRELETLVPNCEVLDLFRLKYDYHNVKVLIKSDAMLQDDRSLLSESGRISTEQMRKLFQEDRLRDLPGVLGSAAQEAKNLSREVQTRSFLILHWTEHISESSSRSQNLLTAILPEAMSQFWLTRPI